MGWFGIACHGGTIRPVCLLCTEERAETKEHGMVRPRVLASNRDAPHIVLLTGLKVRPRLSVAPPPPPRHPPHHCLLLHLILLSWRHSVFSAQSWQSVCTVDGDGDGDGDGGDLSCVSAEVADSLHLNLRSGKWTSDDSSRASFETVKILLGKNTEQLDTSEARAWARYGNPCVPTVNSQPASQRARLGFPFFLFLSFLFFI